MALPLVAGGMIIGGASAWMNIKQRDKLIKWQKEQKALNDKVTVTNYANSLQRSKMAVSKYKARSREAEQEVAIQATQQEGQIKVAAAVTGITGTSVENAISSVKRAKGRAYVSIDQEIEDYVDQVDMQMRTNFESMQSALMSGQVVDMSSDFADVLNISAGVLGGGVLGLKMYQMFGGGGVGSVANGTDYGRESGGASRGVGVQTPWGGR